MSNPEQDQDDQGRRKSKRQRVPNPYYTAGINELKKITLKGQSKKNRTDEDDEYSSDDDKNVSHNYRNFAETHQNNLRTPVSLPWLNCIMPHTKKPMKVRIVIDSTNSPYQTEGPRYKDEQVVKNQGMVIQTQPAFIPSYSSSQIAKKPEPQGGLNLLSLFEKVIKNVSDQIPSPVKQQNISQPYHQNNTLQEPLLKYHTTTHKQPKQTVLAPPPKRKHEEDKDGKILSLIVDKQNKSILIRHSKIGECHVPVDVQPPAWKNPEVKLQEDSDMIEQLKKKLTANPALLKSIPIYH